MIIIGDIGGTHMRIAASSKSDSFDEPLIFDTPKTADEAAVLFTSAIAKVSHGRTPDFAVIGIAGLLSPDNTTLLRSPHLKGWEGEVVADIFRAASGIRTHFKNDAMLGALGETHFGAGKGASILAYVTVGTGVGGARIVHGCIDHAVHGFEIGHQRLGNAINAPELESLVSGSALEEKYGKPAAEINDSVIWDTCADQFAIGLYNTILHWSPNRIVLGGSGFRGPRAIPVARVEETLKELNTALETLPEIHLATLGDSSGLYGALQLGHSFKN